MTSSTRDTTGHSGRTPAAGDSLVEGSAAGDSGPADAVADDSASGDGVDGDASGDELISAILADGRRLQELSLRDRHSPLFDISLTMQQLKVLVAVARGASSGHQLTEILDVGLATVTGIVDRLAAAGMVTRREDPDDRRVRRVVLTAKGRDLIDRLNAAGELATRRLLRHLDPDGLRVVAHAVHLLRDAAETMLAHDDGPPT